MDLSLRLFKISISGVEAKTGYNQILLLNRREICFEFKKGASNSGRTEEN